MTKFRIFCGSSIRSGAARETVAGRETAVGILAILTVALIVTSSRAYATTGSLKVGERPILTAVPRVGVNIEGWSSYGADQLSSNVIMNPGFEPTIDRTIVIVKEANATGFADDTPWMARADGFWDGGSFQVLTGAAAGRAGTVSTSVQHGPDGFGWFRTAGPAPSLTAGDAISVLRVQKTGGPANWWVPPAFKGLVAIRTSVHPPGTSGGSAVELGLSGDQPTQLNSFLDGPHKFLPVNGHWRLSFWARSTAGSATLAVNFGRVIPPSAETFIAHSAAVESKWARTVLEFDGHDEGAGGPLQLGFAATGRPGDAVQLADVELGRVTDLDAGAWRAEVIGALKQLRPGYLRDWQSQLGDTLTNRLAPIFARSPERFNSDPGDQGQSFMYSLPDFLELCHAVGADPWIVAPTTFYDSEFSGLGEYLARAQRTFRFREIAVEFGNENWNSVFRAAGIANPAVMGQAANRAFDLLRKSAGAAVPLHLVVNGMYAYTPLAVQTLIATPAADAVDVGPYYFYTLNSRDTQAAALRAMMIPDDESAQLSNLSATAHQLGKAIDVYEVNLSTTEGDAPATQRNPLLTGMVSGSSLANRLITGMYAGLRRQNVWNLAQYDFGAPTGVVKLYGIMHDLASPDSFRPTGLAVEMLNRAIAGDAYPVSADAGAKGINGAAFLSSAGWSLALVSTAPAPLEVALELPPRGIRPSRLLTLTGPLVVNNDTGDTVRVTEAALPSELRLTIPAYGLVVLLPPTDPR